LNHSLVLKILTMFRYNLTSTFFFIEARLIEARIVEILLYIKRTFFVPMNEFYTATETV
jgi:hypothetical protein